MPTVLRAHNLSRPQGQPFRVQTSEVVLLFSLSFLMTLSFSLVPRVSSIPFSDLNLAYVFLSLADRPVHQVPSSPFPCLVPISWVHSVAEQASASAPRSSGFILPHCLLPASFAPTSFHLSGLSQPPLLASPFVQSAYVKLLRAQPQTPFFTWLLLLPLNENSTGQNQLEPGLALSNYLLTEWLHHSFPDLHLRTRSLFDASNCCFDILLMFSKQFKLKHVTVFTLILSGLRACMLLRLFPCPSCT